MTVDQKNTLIFVSGLAIGALGVYLWHQHEVQKYEADTIDAEDALQVEDIPKEMEEQRVYHEIVTPYSDPQPTEVEDTEHPYVIKPDEYSEFEDYRCHTLTWYKDNALADEQDILIDDVDDLIGSDFMNHFGEYEKDVVYIRNDSIKTDFEICRSDETFFDIVAKRPYLMEDYDDYD